MGFRSFGTQNLFHRFQMRPQFNKGKIHIPSFNGIQNFQMLLEGGFDSPADLGCRN